MTKEPISMDKEYVTSDGCPVRIYATDVEDTYSVHAAYYENGKWWMQNYTKHGQISVEGPDDDLDLIEKPKTHKIVRYMNVYPDGRVSFRSCRGVADCTAKGDRIACVRIEIDVEEGHFDD